MATVTERAGRLLAIADTLDRDGSQDDADLAHEVRVKVAAQMRDVEVSIGVNVRMARRLAAVNALFDANVFQDY